MDDVLKKANEAMEMVRNGKATVNEARENAGLPPKPDPMCDVVLIVQLN